MPPLVPLFSFLCTTGGTYTSSVFVIWLNREPASSEATKSFCFLSRSIRAALHHNGFIPFPCVRRAFIHRLAKFCTLADTLFIDLVSWNVIGENCWLKQPNFNDRRHIIKAAWSSWNYPCYSKRSDFVFINRWTCSELISSDDENDF